MTPTQYKFSMDREGLSTWCSGELKQHIQNGNINGLDVEILTRFVDKFLPTCFHSSLRFLSIRMDQFQNRCQHLYANRKQFTVRWCLLSIPQHGHCLF
jgi:hypothetical protein